MSRCRDKVAVIAGTTGIVGLALARRLLQDKWKVYGISRRKQDFLPKEVHHVAVDLTDKEACNVSFSSLSDVKYAFYTSRKDLATEKENCVMNQMMLENFIDNLPSKLNHVVLVTGTKHYYGTFLDVVDTEINTPYKESLPRLPGYNWYHNQEDSLFDRSQNLGFTWSVARPALIMGFAPFNVVNFCSCIAIYASICKYLGESFVFPGSVACYDKLMDAVDTNLLAEHLVWEATNPNAANEAYNVTNGDLFRWRHIWPRIGEFFGLKAEEPPSKPFDLDSWIQNKALIWEEIVEKYQLKKTKLDDLFTMWFFKYVMNFNYTKISDMTKSRENGFLSYKSTEKSIIDGLNELRIQKYIP